MVLTAGNTISWRNVAEFSGFKITKCLYRAIVYFISCLYCMKTHQGASEENLSRVFDWNARFEIYWAPKCMSICMLSLPSWLMCGPKLSAKSTTQIFSNLDNNCTVFLFLGQNWRLRSYLTNLKYAPFYPTINFFNTFFIWAVNHKWVSNIKIKDPIPPTYIVLNQWCLLLINLTYLSQANGSHNTIQFWLINIRKNKRKRCFDTQNCFTIAISAVYGP